METIKLTKEQSKVLEKMRNCHHLRNDKEELLLKHFTGWKQGYVVLNEIPMIAFAQLVLNDFAYEIEQEQPKFQPGDKVVRIDGREFANYEKLGNVYREEDSGQIVLLKGPKGYRDMPQQWTPDIIRHATPEEIYWLETLGREKVGDFRVGDAITTSEDNEICRVVDKDGSYDSSITSLESAKKWNAAGIVTGIYPADSFKPFPKEQSNARHREN